MATIGDKNPNSVPAQLAVGSGLASVSEAPRAIPYAERGLSLAEKSGDPKLVREALLTGADVYYRAGDYELSRQRAERILKDNPNDKDARMLYMQVKDRGAAASRSPARAPSAPAGAAASGLTPEQRNDGRTGTSAGNAQPTARVAMTSANSLEARRQLDLGRGKMALDPAAALKHFDAAVQNDENDADARIERARARLAAGDAAGARQDADAAVRLAPGKADGWALRADADQALGKAAAELVADYEQAAKLDAKFKDAFEALVAKAAAGTGGAQDATRDVSGRSAPDMARGPMSSLPEPVRKYGALGLLAGALGCVAAGLILRKRSDEDSSREQ